MWEGEGKVKTRPPLLIAFPCAKSGGRNAVLIDCRTTIRVLAFGGTAAQLRGRKVTSDSFREPSISSQDLS